MNHTISFLCFSILVYKILASSYLHDSLTNLNAQKPVKTLKRSGLRFGLQFVSQRQHKPNSELDGAKEQSQQNQEQERQLFSLHPQQKFRSFPIPPQAQPQFFQDLHPENQDIQFKNEHVPIDTQKSISSIQSPLKYKQSLQVMKVTALKKQLSAQRKILTSSLFQDFTPTSQIQHAQSNKVSDFLKQIQPNSYSSLHDNEIHANSKQDALFSSFGDVSPPKQLLLTSIPYEIRSKSSNGAIYSNPMYPFSCNLLPVVSDTFSSLFIIRQMPDNMNLFEICLNDSPDLFFEISDGSNLDGALLQFIYHNEQSMHQKFQIIPSTNNLNYVQIQAMHSRKCLQVASDRTIQQFPCEDVDSQLFTFVRHEN